MAICWVDMHIVFNFFTIDSLLSQTRNMMILPSSSVSVEGFCTFSDLIKNKHTFPDKMDTFLCNQKWKQSHVVAVALSCQMLFITAKCIVYNLEFHLLNICNGENLRQFSWPKMRHKLLLLVNYFKKARLGLTDIWEINQFHAINHENVQFIDVFYCRKRFCNELGLNYKAKIQLKWMEWIYV